MEAITRTSGAGDFARARSLWSIPCSASARTRPAARARRRGRACRRRRARACSPQLAPGPRCAASHRRARAGWRCGAPGSSRRGRPPAAAMLRGRRAPPLPFRLPEGRRAAAARCAAPPRAIASRSARTAALSPSSGPSTRLRASLSSSSRHAQLALERRRALRARAPRATHSPPAGPVARPLLEEPRVVDRARDLVRDDRDEPLLVLAEGPLHRALDREDADQLVAHEQRNRELALGVRKPRHRHGVAELLASPGLHHLPPLRRDIRAHAGRDCRRAAASAASATTPITPVPTRTRPPIACFS